MSSNTDRPIQIGDRVSFRIGSGFHHEGTVFRVKATPRGVTLSIKDYGGMTWMRYADRVTLLP